MSDAKIEAVQRIYAAVGRSDTDAILAELADNVDWAAEAASTSVPWYGTYRGRTEVPRFFQELGSMSMANRISPLAATRAPHWWPKTSPPAANSITRGWPNNLPTGGQQNSPPMLGCSLASVICDRQRLLGSPLRCAGCRHRWRQRGRCQGRI